MNPFRGVPIAPREQPLRERLEQLALPDADRILERWRDLAAAPAWDGPALWLHGDPHPANLLVHDGRLRAVIDFGDVTSGDPASDLSTAWLTFDADGRAAFRDAAGATTTRPGGARRPGRCTWPSCSRCTPSTTRTSRRSGGTGSRRRSPTDSAGYWRDGDPSPTRPAPPTPTSTRSSPPWSTRSAAGTRSA